VGAFVGMDRVGSVVVGGGVVGLACARALARRVGSGSVYLLEGAGSLGSESSSRNSGVIHGGLYYPQGSFKASLCVQGRRLLYDYCRERGVPHTMCGKLVVATTKQEGAKLRAILAAARMNGLSEDQVSLVSACEAKALEPDVECTEALHSRVTGAVCASSLISSLENDLHELRATIVVNCLVQGGAVTKGGFVLETSLGALACDRLINAAGLSAPQLLSRLKGFPQDAVPRATYFARGSYFRLRLDASKIASGGRFQRHVYPLPTDGGLGVHATVDTAGIVRFGPDVEWLLPPPAAAAATSSSPYAWRPDSRPTAKDLYAVDPARCQAFYSAIRQYWPNLPDDALEPDYAGVRAKLSGPGQPAADFCVLQDPRQPRCVSLLGIESPGLTSSLALGELVADRLLLPRAF